MWLDNQRYVVSEITSVFHEHILSVFFIEMSPEFLIFSAQGLISITYNPCSTSNNYMKPTILDVV